MTHIEHMNTLCAKSDQSRAMKLSVFVYVPNLIGKCLILPINLQALKSGEA